MALKWPDKDPDERLDYTVDWSRYLDTLTISSVQWTYIQSDGTESSALSASSTVNGMTVQAVSNTDTTVSIVLSGGTVNTETKFVCQITTNLNTATGAAVVTKRVVNLTVRERV